MSLGESILVGAAAGAAGSAAGQLAGDALGVHQGFSFGELALGAAGGAIAGGVGFELSHSVTFTNNVNGLNASGQAVGSYGAPLNAAGYATEGAASYAGNIEAGKLLNQPEHFSWAGLVASSVGAVVGGELGGQPKAQGNAGIYSQDYLRGIGARAAEDVTTREVSVGLGDHHVQSWAQLAEDVAGNAIGQPIGHAVLGAYQAYRSKQELANINASESTLLTTMQAKLDADIWQGNSLPNDGQTTLDNAWQRMQDNLGNAWPGGNASDVYGSGISAFDFGNDSPASSGTGVGESAGTGGTGWASGSGVDTAELMQHDQQVIQQSKHLDALQSALYATISDPSVSLEAKQSAVNAYGQAAADTANGSANADQSLANADTAVGAISSTYTPPSTDSSDSSTHIELKPVGGERNGALYVNIYGGLPYTVVDGAAPAPTVSTSEGGFNNEGSAGWGQVAGAAVNNIVTGALLGSMNMVYQPIAQVHDLGAAAYALGEQAITGEIHQPDYWSTTGKEAVTDANSWAHTTENLLGSNPITGSALAGWNLGTAISNGNATSVEQQLGGLAGGVLMGKAGLEGEPVSVPATRIEPTVSGSVPNNALVGSEVSALQRIAASNSVDTGSATRMARIDELSTANYNRLLQNDLAGSDHVYRAVPENMLDIYRAQGSITGRGGSPAYFSLEGGESPLQQKLGAQLIDEPQVLLKIPTSDLIDPTVPRPLGYSFTSQTFGREYFVNSYPQYGSGGFRQFIGTTNSYSDSWIVSPWGAK
jgi:hypothetical protein